MTPKFARPLLCALLLLGGSSIASAQSVPNGGITQGQVWTTSQWINAWQTKADATSSAIIGLWSGTCNSTTFLRADGSCQSGGSGSGTVTSVGASSSGTIAITGSPITAAGTLTFNLAPIAAGTLLCNNGGSTATPAACGTLPTAAMPALTGDVTSSAGSVATTVGKINGATVPASAAVIASNSSSQLTALTLGGNLASSSGVLTTTQPLNAQTGTTYAVASSDAGKLITFSNASTIAVSLPVATTTGFTSGFSFDVQNVGGTTGGVATITPTTSTINGLVNMAIPPNTGCTITSDGANYQISACTAYKGIGTQVFTSTGTWTNPAPNGGKTIKVILIGPGGGGGSGASIVSGTASSGGAGGGGGGYAEAFYDANNLPTTVTCTVPAGGVAGTTVTNAAGNTGVQASNTTFGTFLTAFGGGGGQGGASAAASGGGGGAGINGAGVTGAAGTPGAGGGTGAGAGGGSSTQLTAAGGGGSGASGAAGGNAGSSLLGGAGGSGGGGLTTGPAATNSGNSGGIIPLQIAGQLGVSGIGPNGTAPSGYTAGGGGVGGGSSAAGAGNHGGLGSTGSGGGGGGSSISTQASGAGGQGGNGLCVVLSF